MDLSDSEGQYLLTGRRRYHIQFHDMNPRRVLAEVLGMDLVAATLTGLPGDPAPAPAGGVAVRFYG